MKISPLLYYISRIMTRTVHSQGIYRWISFLFSVPNDVVIIMSDIEDPIKPFYNETIRSPVNLKYIQIHLLPLKL